MKAGRRRVGDGRIGLSARLRASVMEQVRRRRAPSELPYRLQHNRIFVLPTRFGWAFGTLLAFMAAGGLNFNNNLALLLVFLAAAVGFAATFLCYRNLRGLAITGIETTPAFAGNQAGFTLLVDNPEQRRRFTLAAGPAGAAVQDCRDLDSGHAAPLHLHVTAQRRGWLPAPPLQLETRYPLGLFRAWSWLFPEARCLVWPRPAPQPPPLPQQRRGETGQAQLGEGEQVHGLRGYRPGDSLRRVAWRTSARHDTLYTREMETPREAGCTLAWDVLAGMDTEDRLSVLTAWVLEADHAGVPWRLELPGAAFGPALGSAHRAQCLQALALHES